MLRNVTRRGWLAATATAWARKKPLRVLIIDGVNNHDWRAGTEFLREVLEANGKFAVEVTTTPERGAEAKEWARWRPAFAKYEVVVSNFNGGHLRDGLRWPREVEVGLESYVRRGGGLVIFHAANNAFLEWPEYNQMVGLLWRDKSFGPGLIVTEAGKIVSVAAGEGLNPGHGPRHDFRVEVLDRRHPITKGLGSGWEHKAEQLTHGQHGPAAALAELRILTYAYSKDSRRREPMDWVRPWGQGRVYTTMLGHTWLKEANPNLEVPEFRRMVAQGVEWAATGKVA